MVLGKHYFFHFYMTYVAAIHSWVFTVLQTGKCPYSVTEGERFKGSHPQKYRYVKCPFWKLPFYRHKWVIATACLCIHVGLVRNATWRQESEAVFPAMTPMPSVTVCKSLVLSLTPFPVKIMISTSQGCCQLNSLTFAKGFGGHQRGGGVSKYYCCIYLVSAGMGVCTPAGPPLIIQP